MKYLSIQHPPFHIRSVTGDGEHAGQAALASSTLIRDAQAIAEIYNSYVDAGGATFDVTHWTTEFVIKQLRLPAPDGWFVAVDESTCQIAGWASVHRFSARHGFRWSCESAIYVRPDALGRGLADALQQRLEAHCHECHVHHLTAKIIADNTRSLAFHRRHGFESVGIQKEIGNMNGQWVDLVILQKILTMRKP